VWVQRFRFRWFRSLGWFRWLKAKSSKLKGIRKEEIENRRSEDQRLRRLVGLRIPELLTSKKPNAQCPLTNITNKTILTNITIQTNKK